MTSQLLACPMNVSSSLLTLRVLVVDDNADLAESMQLLLSFWGHQVETASTGREALEIARYFVPDVVLLDLDIPHLNGFEVAPRLRQIPGLENTFLVAATGWVRDEDRQRSQEAGFDCHLDKPFNFEELSALLAERAASKME